MRCQHHTIASSVAPSVRLAGLISSDVTSGRRGPKRDRLGRDKVFLNGTGWFLRQNQKLTALDELERVELIILYYLKIEDSLDGARQFFIGLSLTLCVHGLFVCTIKHVRWCVQHHSLEASHSSFGLH